MKHIEIIQLIVGYSFAAVLAFTAIITAASLVGWISFSNSNQQKKLFNILIVELVVVGVGLFTDLMRFNPNKAANAVITKHDYISVNAPANYATYTNKAAGIGFAYPDKYNLEITGTDIHHGKMQLKDDEDTLGWLSILTHIPSDSERLLREEQGKTLSYYLARHVNTLKQRMPFAVTGAFYEREEDYSAPIGEGKLVVFEYETSGIPTEIHILLIYTPSHMVHKFELRALKTDISAASKKLRNIVTTLATRDNA